MIEVILPLRNPLDVLHKTAELLAAQTDREFSVLISDNHSTSGREHMETAAKVLREAGLAVRVIQPPQALERVEHWNWAHYQSRAAWLKPLFAGDWLEPAYIGRLREAIAADPRCRYVFSNSYYHAGDAPPVTGENRSGPYRPPAYWQDIVLRYGMQFGPPSAAAYERTAFMALGGYPTTLPITADSLFFCTLAARFGATGLAEPLCHFQLHAGRFSIGLPGKRRDTFRENLIYMSMLAYHAWTERDAFPVGGFLRQLARTVRDHFLKN
jgi:hypothetical protein